jgi:hypothetical protein
MMNLLQETKHAISESGHSTDDIEFIGSEKSGHQCTWAEFEALANREYDHSYGSAEVAQDLVIVFTDGSKMWRGEYDGSEWWEFSRPFVKPETSKPIRNLFVTSVGWRDLEEINAVGA